MSNCLNTGWGSWTSSATVPRLYPSKNLIHGDTSAHYGLELCLASVQMMLIHSVERGRQKELVIHPWLSKDLIKTRNII